MFPIGVSVSVACDFSSQLLSPTGGGGVGRPTGGKPVGPVVVSEGRPDLEGSMTQNGEPPKPPGEPLLCCFKLQFGPEVIRNIAIQSLFYCKKAATE